MLRVSFFVKTEELGITSPVDYCHILPFLLLNLKKYIKGIQGDLMLDPAYRLINDDNALGGSI